MTLEETDKVAQIAYEKYWATYNQTVQVIKYSELSKEQKAAWRAVVIAVLE